MEKSEKIIQAYIEHFIENGTRPASVFAFAKKLKIKEVEFYEFYNSFELLESDIWVKFFETTRKKIEAEEIYATYSVREKLLAFYYTWVEVLKENRSYVILSWQHIDRKKLKTPTFLSPFKAAFKDFANNLVLEGKESREVAARRYLDERYADAFWLQALLILDFWVKDPSKSFEKTDAFIEKAVNTSFDLIGASALDSVLDLAKFLYQHHKA